MALCRPKKPVKLTHGHDTTRSRQGVGDVTVCIGAICESGGAVIVAADRMMTYGAPMNLQVEGAVRKIIQLTEHAALLFSGTVPDGEQVATNSLDDARRRTNRYCGNSQHGRFVVSGA